MRERPILFSGPMVRAILAGTKTQTRRVVKPQPVADANWVGGGYWERNAATITQPIPTRPCIPDMTEFGPYGQPGDRLWVRETWNKFPPWEGCFYAADDHSFGIGECDDSDHIEPHDLRWRPSIHMPREASRITLEITEIRVERLNEISEEDAKAEGINGYPFRPDDGFPICIGYTHRNDDGKCALHPTPPKAFAELWESINGPGSWEQNPYVWVIAFRRVAPLVGEGK